MSLDIAQAEADFAIEKGAKVDPYNESPLRYLIAVLKEQLCQSSDSHALLAEYEAKTSSLGAILSNSNRDPDECFNLTFARIDILEMMGDKDSLEKVGNQFLFWLQTAK